MTILEKLKEKVDSYSIGRNGHYVGLDIYHPLYLSKDDYEKYFEEVKGNPGVGLKQLWFCGIPVYIEGTKPKTLKELKQQ